jgi:ribosomal protein L37E
MSLPKQVLCKRCGREMRTVAEIPPMGGDNGLLAFLCVDAECGTADAVLVRPTNWTAKRRKIEP